MVRGKKIYMYVFIYLVRYTLFSVVYDVIKITSY